MVGLVRRSSPSLLFTESGSLRRDRLLIFLALMTLLVWFLRSDSAASMTSWYPRNAGPPHGLRNATALGSCGLTYGFSPREKIVSTEWSDLFKKSGIKFAFSSFPSERTTCFGGTTTQYYDCLRAAAQRMGCQGGGNLGEMSTIRPMSVPRAKTKQAETLLLVMRKRLHFRVLRLDNANLTRIWVEGELDRPRNGKARPWLLRSQAALRLVVSATLKKMDLPSNEPFVGLLQASWADNGDLVRVEGFDLSGPSDFDPSWVAETLAKEWCDQEEEDLEGSSSSYKIPTTSFLAGRTWQTLLDEELDVRPFPLCSLLSDRAPVSKSSSKIAPLEDTPESKCETDSRLSCETLGWEVSLPNRVCVSTRVLSLEVRARASSIGLEVSPTCRSSPTSVLSEAEEFCRSGGARLCRVSEIQAAAAGKSLSWCTPDAAAHGGDGLTWTSTECDEGRGRIVIHPLQPSKEICMVVESDLVFGTTRCCADAAKRESCLPKDVTTHVDLPIEALPRLTCAELGWRKLGCAGGFFVSESQSQALTLAEEDPSLAGNNPMCGWTSVLLKQAQTRCLSLGQADLCTADQVAAMWGKVDEYRAQHSKVTYLSIETNQRWPMGPCSGHFVWTNRVCDTSTRPYSVVVVSRRTSMCAEPDLLTRHSIACCAPETRRQRRRRV